MEIKVTGTPKEIVDLILGLQGQLKQENNDIEITIVPVDLPQTNQGSVWQGSIAITFPRETNN